ncbi:hypothetical protein GCM10023317_15900 [Actinopolymorpha pittospori]
MLKQLRLDDDPRADSDLRGVEFQDRRAADLPAKSRGGLVELRGIW